MGRAKVVLPERKEMGRISDEWVPSNRHYESIPLGGNYGQEKLFEIVLFGDGPCELLGCAHRKLDFGIDQYSDLVNYLWDTIPSVVVGCKT